MPARRLKFKSKHQQQYQRKSGRKHLAEFLNFWTVCDVTHTYILSAAFTSSFFCVTVIDAIVVVACCSVFLNIHWPMIFFRFIIYARKWQKTAKKIATKTNKLIKNESINPSDWISIEELRRDECVEHTLIKSFEFMICMFVDLYT